MNATLLGVAIVVGWIPTLSPDHWIALTLGSWLKGATRAQAYLFAVLLSGVHCALGAGAALAAAAGLRVMGATPQAERAALIAATAVVAILWLRRALTLDRTVALMRTFRPAGAGNSWRSIFMRALGVIGPAELVVPLVLRAQMVYPDAAHAQTLALVLAGYAAGAVLGAVGAVRLMSVRWDDPAWLASQLNRFSVLICAVFAAAWALSFSATPALAAHGLADPAFESDKPYILISDVDDTIKISHVASATGLAKNALFETRIFAGTDEWMERLYPRAETILLSNAFGVFRPWIHHLIEERGLPVDELITRSIGESGWNHKSDALDQIAARADSNGRMFVLVGDDTEKDPEVYAAFRDRVGADRVAGIWIHAVSGRKLPAGEKRWLTAFDLADAHLQLGLLTEAEASDVGVGVLTALTRDPESVIPDWAYCPRGAHPMMVGEGEIEPVRDLDSLRLEVRARIRALCQSRH